jgi:hypothetical protein
MCVSNKYKVGIPSTKIVMQQVGSHIESKTNYQQVPNTKVFTCFY